MTDPEREFRLSGTASAQSDGVVGIVPSRIPYGGSIVNNSTIADLPAPYVTVQENQSIWVEVKTHPLRY